MRWYKDLYVGERARKKRYKLISRIRYSKLQTSAYVIIPASNGNNILDIYPAYALLHKRLKDSDLLILGIADGKDEAMEVAGKIIAQMYRENGDFDLRHFLETKGCRM